MKKNPRKGLETLKSPKRCHPKGLNDLFRNLTAIEARKRWFEIQLRIFKERTKSLTEMLQKIHEEEADLTKRLKLSELFPSDNGEGRKQRCFSPKTERSEGKEMVFRF
jgi:hypothetical protein